MENQKRKLVLASFSQTVAKTNVLNINGHNIDTIFAESIRIMFGYEGVAILERMQALNHRVPIQKIFIHIMADPRCVLNLRSYLKMPNEIKLNGHDPTPKIFKKEFVELNVVQLFNQIGSIVLPSYQKWPEIYPGFRDFRKELTVKGIDLGIISASYSKFILDVFEKQEIEHPLFCITPDDEFGLPGIDWESTNKPSALLIAKAFERWNIDMDYAKKNTIMIGDDMELDGKMAESAGIPFWYFTSDINNVVLSENQRSFSNWGQLVNALKNNQLFF